MREKKNVANISVEEVALRGIAYVSIKDRIKKLEDENKENRKPLETYLDATATPTTNGSFIEIPYCDKIVTIKKTFRSSRSLSKNFADLLKAAGFEDCIKYEPTIDEEKLEAYYHRGKVSDRLLNSLYDVKSTSAFSVQIKDRYE